MRITINPEIQKHTDTIDILITETIKKNEKTNTLKKLKGGLKNGND